MAGGGADCAPYLDQAFYYGTARVAGAGYSHAHHFSGE